MIRRPVLMHSNSRYFQSVVGLNQTYVYSDTNAITELRLSRV